VENSFTALNNIAEDCYYKCYHCDCYQSNDEADYKHHNVLNHTGKGAYPSKADIEKLGLKPQGKPWET
jgi:hypothetical protein